MRQFKGLIKLLAFGIIISFLLPVVKIGPIGVKPDFFFLLFASPVLLIERTITRFRLIRIFGILLILLFISLTISNNLGSYYYLEQFEFSVPTEFYQMFSRLTVFALFLGIGYYNIIDWKTFVNFVAGVFLLGLTFGVVQSFGVGFIDSISLNYYAITDQQVKGFSSANFRGFGTSGNILTWGGLCVLTFYFFYFLVKNRVIKVLGVVLSILCILLAASRSALFALGSSFLIIYFYENVIIKKRYSKFFVSILYVAVFLLLFYQGLQLFFPERIELMMLRLMNSEADMTENSRGAQITQFMGFLDNDSLNYIFGIGKDVLNSMGYMEVEPVFLLSAYGIVGVVLHYFTVYYLYKYIKAIKSQDNRYFFMYACLMSMMIFSLGYFFFREAYSGMIFWWLTGYVLGNMYYELNMNNRIYNEEN